jgi:hypothetical protein
MHLNAILSLPDAALLRLFKKKILSPSFSLWDRPTLSFSFSLFFFPPCGPGQLGSLLSFLFPRTDHLAQLAHLLPRPNQPACPFSSSLFSLADRWGPSVGRVFHLEPDSGLTEARVPASPVARRPGPHAKTPAATL